MAGYSALPAMEINPVGFGADNALKSAQAQDAWNTAQVNQSLIPQITAAKTAELTAQTQQAPLETQIKQAQATDATSTSQNTQLANVATRALAAGDPETASQVWDEGMQAQVQAGNTAARQYIGRYKEDLAQGVRDSFSGQPSGASRARDNTAALNPANDPTMIMRAITSMSPLQRQKALQQQNAIITGFNRITDEASFNSEVDQLRQAGIPVDQYLQPGADWHTNYRLVHNHIMDMVPRRDMLADVVDQEATGMPPPQAAPLFQPDWKYIGPDKATGKPVYKDAHSGQEMEGANAVGAKPSAGMSTALFKQQAWLQAYPGDTQGALEFMNGKRSMDPQQMQAIAMGEANKEYGNAALAGEEIANPDAWIRQKAQANFQALSQAAAPPPANPSAQLPQRALQAVQAANGQPVRFNNGFVYKWVNGKAVRVS